MRPTSAQPSRALKQLNPSQRPPGSDWGFFSSGEAQSQRRTAPTSSRTASIDGCSHHSSSPLDLSRVSYDKCVASLQSRPGPIRADDKLDFEHNWTSMHMNNDSDAPIIGHTREHFRDAQRTNCKNSRSKQAPELMRA